jgi:hypothetical protein
MINAAGLGTFHLQALAPDDSGVWQVVFEAAATLVQDGVLAVSALTGAWPALAGVTAFFRLWDAVHDVAAFTSATELADGIRLAFDPPVPGGANYRPGDRWLFPSRAAGTGFDPALWPSNALPDAIRYHRAPLAILNWTAAPPVTLDAAAVDDCRDSFPPLTDPCPCCTIAVGDGIRTHGDEDSIEAAIARLPSTGGKICLLPGTHATNALIRDRANIRITGCDRDTRVIPRSGSRDAPVFTVIDSEAITLTRMEIISLSGTGVLALESDEGLLRQLTVEANRIVASTRGIEVRGGTETLIRENRIRMLDRTGAGVAIFLTGENSRIERNDLGVVPAASTPRPPDGGDGDGDQPDDPNDPCADPETIYRNPGFLITFVQFLFGFLLTAILPPPYRALGGIQIGAGAELVAVLDNRILGGAGHGVTLGGGVSAGEPDPDGSGPAFFDLALGSPALALRGTAIAPDGTRAAGVTLRVTAPSGAVRSAVTAASGEFAFDGTGERGTHRFETGDPALGVAKVTITERVNVGAGTLYVLDVALAALRPGPDPAFAFLYAIRVEDNEITGMGLNGVGIPPPAGVLPERPGVRAPANPLLAALGNPLIDLAILRNRISGNLVTPFTAAMSAAAATFGFGGIGLGACDTPTITGNRIEANGRRHFDPVCGIFVLLGEQVEITDNLIRDNGPFVTGPGEAAQGQRGGISGIFLATGLDDAPDDKIMLPAAGKPALRLHDNVVEQPMGRALTVLAAGPVSIQGNFLAAERTLPLALDRLAGVMLLLSFSGVGRLPQGGCLVTDNQIRLGHASDAFVAVALAAAGDIGFDSNQCDAFHSGLAVENAVLTLNTLVIAATARATGNRLIDRPLSGDNAFQLSLLASTLGMNTTTTNQADHCIVAVDRSTPSRLVAAGNLVLDAARCQSLAGAEGAVAVRPVFGLHGLAGAAFRKAAPPTAPEALRYHGALDGATVELDGLARARLAEAANTKAATRALIANELARLDARGGARPDLLAANEARLARATLLADRLVAAGQVVAAKPASARKGALMIQGRVRDADGRGVPDREVRLADPRGRLLEPVPAATTDPRGVYALTLDKEELREIAELIRKGGTVVSGKARTDAFAVTDDSTVAPDLVLADLRSGGAGAGPLTRRAGPAEPVQRLERPVLTAAARPRQASGRVAGLIAQAMRNPRKGEG